MTTTGAYAPEPSNAPERVSFFFAAHEDDWQLFMNPPAFRDVLDEKARCVFVHVTAGDAGHGVGCVGRKYPYYLARENGAETAIRFMADANDRRPIDPTVSAISVAGHAIRRVGYRNTVAYFLRLPDGSPAGSGYADTGYQSLKRLAKGEIDELSAVDSTTRYRGWDDLTSTIRGIIDLEREPDLAIEFHVPETDPATNPNEHADHVFTAEAVLAAGKGLPARWVRHVGYASGNLSDNLGAEDRDMKSAVYAVTLAGVLALDHSVSWQHYDQLFIGRGYYRVETGRQS
jgi:hypothetical protein